MSANMTQNITPDVSAIIPTRNRPEQVERAILSVLNQTFTNFEIIVVVDGPNDKTNPATLKALDPRVKILSLPRNVGLAEARNEGIRFSKGKWVALLDDDDEWLPEKLRLQVAKALELGGDYVFVPCKFIEKTASLERVMPNCLPSGPSKFSEYMYCDQGYLQPSMYFMSRALCIEVPFSKGLRHIEDSDWLLRATRHPAIQVGSVDQPLSIYYNINDGKRESEGTPWEFPLRWAIEHHELFTRRAFPFFVARLSINARSAGEPIGVLFHLMHASWLYGSFSLKSLAYFAAYWFLPSHKLRQLRAVFQ
jgi:glycosyltransferase involved in cell wall biosynthesis